MNLDLIIRSLGSLNFRQAVWLFPVAYVLQVLEELPQFTNWARHYAAASFTLRDYLVIHLSGIAVAVLAPAVIWFFPNKTVTLVFIEWR